jgi:hypothetical protein
MQIAEFSAVESLLELMEQLYLAILILIHCNPFRVS